MSSGIDPRLAQALTVVEYDRRFLVASWEWLNDEEIRALTNTPIFSRDDQERWFESLASRTDYLVWGVELDGEPIGVFGLKNIASDAGEYWGYIGQKVLWGRGIGRWIIERALERAAAANLRRLYLKVVPTNTRAIRLYRDMGFVQTKAEAGLLHMERV